MPPMCSYDNKAVSIKYQKSFKVFHFSSSKLNFYLPD